MNDFIFPAKVARFVDAARGYGLIVSHTSEVIGNDVYLSVAIASPDPGDLNQVWLYHVAGASTRGRLSATVYRPARANGRRKATVKSTLKSAWIWLEILGDAAVGYAEREAARRARVTNVDTARLGKGARVALRLSTRTRLHAGTRRTVLDELVRKGAINADGTLTDAGRRAREILRAPAVRLAA